ncbi:hypothetical protein SUGI_0934790 [Cryptomeria japonica]|nr:hypothetical protein SUGI_0934790 [Cryptomeria japonica]
MEKLIGNIKLATEEIINGKHKAQGRYYNIWDQNMERKWHLKDYKMGSKGKSKKVKKKHVRWKVPAPDWLKLNFYGASQGNLGSSSYGAVVCNNKGELIVGTSGKIRKAANN